MTDAKPGDATVCCLCGHRILSRICPHPWGKAFSEWPELLMAQIRQVDPCAWPVDGETR